MWRFESRISKIWSCIRLLVLLTAPLFSLVFSYVRIISSRLTYSSTVKFVAAGFSKTFATIYLTSSGHYQEAAIFNKLRSLPVYQHTCCVSQLVSWLLFRRRSMPMAWCFVRKWSRREHMFRIGFQPTVFVSWISPDSIHKFSCFILIQMTIVMYISSLNVVL
jgi:hypothetical protein